MKPLEPAVRPGECWKMLNRLSGWLLCLQLVYVTLFGLGVVADKLTGGGIFWATAGIRRTLHLENTLVRLSDYLFYPLIGTVPLNLLLLLMYCGTLLHRRRAPALTTEFFCILNALILTPCALLLFAVFARMIGH